ncbi:MAG: potassium transporter [Flavobacterium sp.]|nr:potassium transporter [Flavobacterium sp.]
MKNDSLLKVVYRFFDLIVLTFLVFDFGYSVHDIYKTPKLVGLVAITVALLIFNIVKFFHFRTGGLRKIVLVNMILIGALLLISLAITLANYDLQPIEILNKIRPILEGGLVIYFIMRLMLLVRYIYDVYYNPAIVFVGSFFALILLGSFLLLLPTATVQEITFTDALFTATTAVCVTGLSVLNIGSDFTFLGQVIILGLIQVGGLGILTFTSFFAFFFRGSSSFKEGLNVRDFIAQDTLKDVLRVALHVVTFTISVEIIGAILIYSSISGRPEIDDKLFFSIFHSVSAFCNAGISTLPTGLSENFLKFNYYMQWVLMILIVSGGLGYNIIVNFYQYIKVRTLELLDRSRIHKEIRIVTLNSKIVLYTTGILLVVGFAFMFIFESGATLDQHQTIFGKITTSAFNSVLPRTAGFQINNMADYTVPSVLFIILLMWIGASPASTGGGIKTSTFALASLNILAVASGKNRIQLFGRRISSESTSRAFAIICISLMVIGSAILGLLIFEPAGTDLLTVALECFSAYSTAGMSLNFTPTLTEPSKYIIMITMFIGRIGMLNLMIGLLRQINHQFYEYPKENILIN